MSVSKAHATAGEERREWFLALESSVAAITQQACLLWNIARGKGTEYTESKIKISVMDDFSQ